MTNNHTVPHAKVTELTTGQMDLVTGGIIIVGGVNRIVSVADWTATITSGRGTPTMSGNLRNF